ncbi:hypothetical protein T08_13079 [Trichinella sp. T8]|nr:hypothetical protein T08_13079 [Trichinella sp. T8]
MENTQTDHHSFIHWLVNEQNRKEEKEKHFPQPKEPKDEKIETERKVHPQTTNRARTGQGKGNHNIE